MCSTHDRRASSTPRVVSDAHDRHPSRHGQARTRTPARAAIAATVLLWASAFVAIRAALPGYGHLGLTSGRLLVAACAFALIALLRRIRCPARADLLRLTLAGLLGMFCYQLFLNSGEVTVTAATASIIMATAPMMTAAMASRVLGEKVTVRHWVGFVVAMSGVALVTVGAGGRFRLETGALLVLLAATAHAAYFVLIKPLLGRYRPLEVTAWATWLGALFAVPLLPALGARAAEASAEATLSVLHLGVGASALGFYTWSVALRHVPATAATTYLYFIPPTTALLGWVWLGETLSAVTVAGGVAVVAGVWVGRNATK